MAFMKYLVCILLITPAMSQGRGDDLLKQFCLHKDEQAEVDAQAAMQLEEELSKEKEFQAFDKTVAREGSHIDRHRKFTFSSKESVERGIDHRLNAITVTKSLEIKMVPPTLVKPLLDAGFGPKVFCGDNCTCDINSRFRTADGSCNNLKHTHWGQASIPMRRWLDPVYQDGVSSPRQLANSMMFLPSARTVSVEVHQLSDVSDLSTKFTHMLMQWGQFLDHDITSTPTQQGGYTGGPVGCCAVLFSGSGIPQSELDHRPQCFPIKIEAGDPHFTQDCMNFVRSVQVENAKCNPAPVEQLNQITAFVDASQMYGSSQEEQNELRTFVDGLMKVKTPAAKDYLPEDTSAPHSCDTSTAPDYCFKAGDHRVNENPTLQSMHTLFLWEHNRIAKELKEINCHWDDERLFQETRKIVGALIQEITYDEYLPILLGHKLTTKLNLKPIASGYTSLYDTETDASIRNSFATAAFRVGHSMIRSFFSSFSASYSNLGSDQLRTIYGNTHKILSEANRDVDHYHRGLVQDAAQKVDGKLTPEVTRHLFEDSRKNSFDLAALNIQRGRDHGLDTYMKFRQFCGRPAVTTFSDLADTHSSSSISLLQNAYASPLDIDLFTGGLTEIPLPDALVGPTFACLLSEQFQVLKEGDRFWFEEHNGDVAFSSDQLTELRKASLSRVICDNTDTVKIQTEAFKINPIKVSCSSLPMVDLWKWKEAHRDSWSRWGLWGKCIDGIQTRTRDCVPCNCGCVGFNAESRRCDVCTFKTWGRCIGNVRRRTRVCTSTQSQKCYGELVSPGLIEVPNSPRSSPRRRRRGNQSVSYRKEKPF